MNSSTPSDPDIFTDRSQDILLNVAIAISCVSLYASIIVLVSYFFILWYQASMANRVSLRLIVFACTCDVICGAMGLVITGVLDTSMSCRVIIYFIIVTDVMSVACLSMIGLNLVMILIVRVDHPHKMEKYYYAFIAFMGLVVVICPLAAYSPVVYPIGTSCWHFYYYAGRTTRLFKWMWYYGCLLFCSLLAFICSTLTIAKFARRRDLFLGIIDMARGDAARIEAGHAQRPFRPGQKTTVVFRKVILRCMCYPLIPMITKGTGVGIQIAAIVNAYIPLGILIADACLYNLLGLFISCIYFTDPSVLTVGREITRRIKRRYVDDYLSALPPNKRPEEPTRGLSESYSRQRSKRFYSAEVASTITPLSSREDLARSSPSNSLHSQQTDEATVNSHGVIMVKKRKHPQVYHSRPTSVTLALLALAKEQATREASDPSWSDRGRRFTHPHIDTHDSRRADVASPASSYWSSNSSKASSIEQSTVGILLSTLYHTLFPCMAPDEARERRTPMMPMHRITDDRSRKQILDTLNIDELWAMDIIPRNRSQSPGIASAQHSTARNERVQIVEAYKHPLLAILTHWILVTVFRVKSPSQHGSDLMETVNITTGQTTRLNREVSDASSEATSRSQDDALDNQPSGFFRRTSMRAVSFASVHSEESDTKTRLVAPSVDTAEGYRNDNNDSFLHPETEGGQTEDVKGKRPMLHRILSHDREPPFLSLKPGKEGVSPKPTPSAASDHGEKFVVKVTDESGGSQEHEEILPVHPTDPTKQPAPSRPRLLRKVSDMQPWARNPLFFNVLGRGPSPSKSILRAKQFAERVGDVSLIKSKHRHPMHETPPASLVSEKMERLSPSTTSSISAFNAKIAFPLEPRPQHTYDGHQHSGTGMASSQVLVRHSLLLDDFGIDYTADSAQALKPTLSEETRRAVQESNTIEEGFSYGVARVITVRNWDESDVDRVIIREGTWDIDRLFQTELESM